MQKRIGEFLKEKGLITEAQVQDILKYSQATGMRFGDSALALKILTQEQLIHVFGPNYRIDFFHLEPGYFPQVTRDLLPPETLIRLGVLPLGFKTERRWFKTRRILNLGLLNPARLESVEEALRLARSKPLDVSIDGARVFLVLGDQFLEVLRQNFDIDLGLILKTHPESQVDETLSLFLDGESRAELKP